jgi:thiol-disulfide isomerase/thioredoxin
MRPTHRFALTLAAPLLFGASALSAQAAQSAVKATDNAAAKAPAAPMVTPPPAATLIDAARATAKKDGKNVLVEFGASWCGWCHKFEAFLDEPVVGKIMKDNFVVVSLIVLESPEKKALENPGGNQLLQDMAGGPSGIPFFFVVDPAGKKLGDANIVPPPADAPAGTKLQNVGHPATVEEVKAFDGFLRVTAPKMTEEQRKLIHNYLEKAAGREVVTTTASR